MEYVLVPGDVRPSSSASVKQAQRPAQRQMSTFPSHIAGLLVAYLSPFVLVKVFQHPVQGWNPTFEAFARALPILLSRLLNRIIVDFKDKAEKENRFRMRQPGFQLLATCKQAYEEGHRLFYDDNVFHLPRGPVSNTREWLNKIRLEHRDMIRTVCVTMSLADLTPLTISHIEKTIIPPRYLPRTNEEQSFVFRTAAYLKLELWMNKLHFSQDWKTLETVYIKTGDETIPFGGEAFRELDIQHLYTILEDAGGGVAEELQGMVDSMGLKATKDWLKGRGGAGKNKA
ncbi:hypothetical protein OEA41_006122 [Lepraria neglecta]|uniref:Uncharacterized protein n=1 Tax=Lepraria neglecta TaxID=209136 RepID=A0AAE0DJY5_9LECA|nr:hypothetical protein OEA41_006122 [Lepraria neglecta]